MNRLACGVLVLLLAIPTAALADKDKHERDKPKVPPVVVVPPVVAGGVAVVEVADIAIATALGYAAVAGVVAYAIYYQLKHPGPPGFAGQQWSTCADAKRYSATEKACQDAGFLH